MFNKIQKQRALTVELILNDVVEDLQEEEDEVVICVISEQEPRGGERLERMG